MHPPRRVGTGLGNRRPAGPGGRWSESTLTRWQVGQVRMYFSTAAARPGHHTERRASEASCHARSARQRARAWNETPAAPVDGAPLPLECMPVTTSFFTALLHEVRLRQCF